MKILVLSHFHSLFPFAHRLRLEGHDVSVVVWRAGQSTRYERAWDGSFERIFDSVMPIKKGDSRKERDEKKKALNKAIEGLIEGTLESGATVISSSFQASEKFKQVQNLFPAFHSDNLPSTPVRLGAWFDGEQMQAPHGLYFDEGVWPGGMGHQTPGGLTLVRIDTPEGLGMFQMLTDPYRDELKSRGFRGLVQFGLDLKRADGVPQIAGIELGWPFLHTHAFLDELESFGAILGTGEPLMTKKYVVMAPVSIPPWPSKGTEPAERCCIHSPREGMPKLTEQWQGRFFWHDVTVDREKRELWTAGLDGLVGVARGSGNTIEAARARCLELLDSIQLPQKQYRMDVGSQTAAVLGGFEVMFDITF